jgi:hypothetical protein
MENSCNAFSQHYVDIDWKYIFLYKIGVLPWGLIKKFKQVEQIKQKKILFIPKYCSLQRYFEDISGISGVSGRL